MTRNKLPRLWLLLVLSSAIAIAISLAGCARIKIKDSEWCADEGALGAECFHALSTNQRTLTKAEWDQERFGQVCTSTDGFTNWREAIEKFCAQNQGECKKELLSAQHRIQKKILGVRKKLGLGAE